MDYERILYEKIDGNIIKITLNRPEKRNAIDNLTQEELWDAFVQADLDEDVNVIVLSAAGKDFSAGFDISGKGEKARGPVLGKVSQTRLTGIEKEIKTLGYIIVEQAKAIRNVSKPTIAMVDGFALGGGTELALSCDIRIASERATFGQPEINLGLIPGGGGTQRLCRLVGYGKAMEMVLTGDMVSAQEALAIGLVNKVVGTEDLETATMAIAESMAKKSPYTIRVAKRAVRAALDLPFTEGVLMERSEFVALFDTEDKEVGVSAFLERSEAEWVGR